MPIGPAQNFPTLEEVMTLTRSIVRDTFPGIAGVQGRIYTDAAPWTLPFLNSAIRWMNRALRNEGVTFPIVDGFQIQNLGAQTSPDPAVICSLTFDGWFNGTVTDGTKLLPSDLFQPLVLRQRQSGQNQSYSVMQKAQQGLISIPPQQWFGQWEWRGYGLFINGSLLNMDLQLRYVQGQLPFNTLPADFATTVINVQDCQEAIAHKQAELYGRRNNGDAQLIAQEKADAEEAIQEMALAYVRTQQGTNYRRPSYQGGGSQSQSEGYAGEVGPEF